MTSTQLGSIIDSAIKRTGEQFKGHTFEEMTAECRATMAKLPKVQLKDPPRI